eukprot:tig00020553_g10741.t1
MFAATAGTDELLSTKSERVCGRRSNANVDMDHDPAVASSSSRSHRPRPRPGPATRHRSCTAAVAFVLVVLTISLCAEARPRSKPFPFGVKELHESTEHEIDWFKHVPDARFTIGRHPHGHGHGRGGAGGDGDGDGDGDGSGRARDGHAHGAGAGHSSSLRSSGGLGSHAGSGRPAGHHDRPHLRRHPLAESYPQLNWMPAESLRKRRAYSQHVSRRLRSGHTVELHYDHAVRPALLCLSRLLALALQLTASPASASVSASAPASASPVDRSARGRRGRAPSKPKFDARPAPAPAPAPAAASPTPQVPRENVHNLDHDAAVESVLCMDGALHVAVAERKAAERLARMPRGTFLVGSDAWRCTDGSGESGPIYRQLLEAITTRGGVTLFTRPAAALDLWEHLDLRYNVPARTYPVFHDPDSFLGKLHRKEKSPGRSLSKERPLLHSEKKAEVIRELSESLRPYLAGNGTFSERERAELRGILGGLRQKHGRQLRWGWDDIEDAFDDLADWIDDLGGKYDVTVEAKVSYNIFTGQVGVDIPGITDVISRLRNRLASKSWNNNGFNYDPETRSALKPIDILGGETEVVHFFCHNCFVVMNPGQIEISVKATVTVDLTDFTNLLGVSLSEFKMVFKAESGAGAGVTVRLAPQEEVDMLVQMQDDLLTNLELESLANNYIEALEQNATAVEDQEAELEKHRAANSGADRPIAAPVNAPAVTRAGSRNGKPVQRTRRVQRTRNRAATRTPKPVKGQVAGGLAPKKQKESAVACDPNEIECSVKVLDKWIMLGPVPVRITGYLFIDLDTTFTAGDPYIMTFDPVVFAGLEVGFKYTSEDGWNPVTDFYYEAHFPNPQFTVPRQRGEILLFLKTGAKLKLFDLVGPRFIIGPKVNLTIDLPTPRCKDPTRIPADELDYSHHFAEISIDIGLTPAIGVEAELAFETPSIDLELLTIPELKFSVANIKYDFELYTFYFGSRPLWNWCVRVEPDEAPAPTVGITGVELSTGRILMGRPAVLEAMQTAGDKLLYHKWETNADVNIEELCGGRMSCQLRFPTAGTFWIKITMFGRNEISASAQTTFNVENDKYWLAILGQVDRMLVMNALTLQPSSNATFDVRFFGVSVVHESVLPVLFMPSIGADYTGIPQPLWWWVLSEKSNDTRYIERNMALPFERFGIRSAYLYAYFESGDFNETYAAPVYRFEIASTAPAPPRAILRSPAYWGEFATIDAYVAPSAGAAVPTEFQWRFNSAPVSATGGATFMRRFCAVGQHSVQIAAANFVGTSEATSTIVVQSKPPPNVDIVYSATPALLKKRNPACPEGTLCAVQWVPFLQYSYTVNFGVESLVGVAPVSWDISFGDGETLSVSRAERYQAEFNEEDYCGPQFESHSGTHDYDAYGARTFAAKATNVAGDNTGVRPWSVAAPPHGLKIFAIGSLTLWGTEVPAGRSYDATLFRVDTSPRYDGITPPIVKGTWANNVATGGGTTTPVCNRGEWGIQCFQELTPTWTAYYKFTVTLETQKVGDTSFTVSHDRYLMGVPDWWWPDVLIDTGLYSNRPLAYTNLFRTSTTFGSPGNAPAFVQGRCIAAAGCTAGLLETTERLRLTRAGVAGAQYGGIFFPPVTWEAVIANQFRFDAEVSMGSDTPGGGGVILGYGLRTTSRSADRALFVQGIGYLPTAGVSVVVLSVQRKVELYWPGRTLLHSVDIPDPNGHARLRGDPDPVPTRVRLRVFAVDGTADRCASVYVEDITAVDCKVLPNWAPKRDWVFAVSGFTGYADGNHVDEISLHYVFVRAIRGTDSSTFSDAVALVPATAHTATPFIDDFQYSVDARTEFPSALLTNSTLHGVMSESFPFWDTSSALSGLGMPGDNGLSFINYIPDSFGAWSFYLDWARFFRVQFLWWVNWGGCGATFAFGDNLGSSAGYGIKEPAATYGRVPGRSGLTIQLRTCGNDPAVNVWYPPSAPAPYFRAPRLRDANFRDVIVDVRPAGNERDALLSVFWVDQWVVKDLVLLAWFPKKDFQYSFLAENLPEHGGVQALMYLRIDRTLSGPYVNVFELPSPEYYEYDTMKITWTVRRETCDDSSSPGNVDIDLLHLSGDVLMNIARSVPVDVAFQELERSWQIPAGVVGNFYVRVSRTGEPAVKDVTGTRINALPRNELSIRLGAQPAAPLYSDGTYWNGAKLELVWTSRTYGIFTAAAGYSNYRVDVWSGTTLVATLGPPGSPNQLALDYWLATSSGGRLVWTIPTEFVSSEGTSQTFVAKVRYSADADPQNTFADVAVKIGRRRLTSLSASSSVAGTTLNEPGSSVPVSVSGAFWSSFSYRGLRIDVLSSATQQVIRENELAAALTAAQISASAVSGVGFTWTVPTSLTSTLSCGAVRDLSLRASWTPTNALDVDGVKAASVPVRVGVRDVPSLLLDAPSPAAIYHDDLIPITWRNTRSCGQTTTYSLVFTDPSNPSTTCSIVVNNAVPSVNTRNLRWDEAVACAAIDNIPSCTRDKVLQMMVTTVYQGKTYPSNSVSVKLTKIKRKTPPPLVLRGASNADYQSVSNIFFSYSGEGFYPFKRYSVSWITSHCEMEMAYTISMTNVANAAETCTVNLASADGRKGGTYELQPSNLWSQCTWLNHFTWPFGWFTPPIRTATFRVNMTYYGIPVSSGTINYLIFKPRPSSLQVKSASPESINVGSTVSLTYTSDTGSFPYTAVKVFFVYRCLQWNGYMSEIVDCRTSPEYPQQIGPSAGLVQSLAGCTSGSTCSISFRVNGGFPSMSSIQVEAWAGLAYQVRVCLDYVDRSPTDNPWVASTPAEVMSYGGSVNVLGNCWPVSTSYSARRHILESLGRELPPSPARLRGLKQASGDLWIEASTQEPFVGEPVTFTARYNANALSGYSFFWELDIGGATAVGTTAVFTFTSPGVASVILQASKANAQDPTVQDELYAFLTVESRSRPAGTTITESNLLPSTYTGAPTKPPTLTASSPEVLATGKVLVGLATGITVTGPDVVEACSDTPASFRFASVANASIAYPVTLRVAFGDGSPDETRTVTNAAAWPAAVVLKSFGSTGTYKVDVAASNSAGQTASAFYVTSIAGPPRGLSANISSSVIRTGQNVTVTASRTAGCGPVQYWVDWGELVAPETFLLTSSGVHSYQAYGQMNLTLKAISTEGNSSLVIPIEVLPQSPSDLSIKTEGTPVAGRPIKAMAFADKGDDPMAFRWDALTEGDGFAIPDTNATYWEVWGQEVSFTPASPGDRTVRVTAFNPAGNVSRDFVISVSGAPPSVPKIRTANGNASAPMEGTAFEISAEVESGNGPFTFEWKLEAVSVEGERWICKRPIAESVVTKNTGANPTTLHTFTEGGPKRVTVVVSSRWGSAQASLEFDVAGAQPINVSIAVEPSVVVVGENSTVAVSWSGTGPFEVALNFPASNFTLHSTGVRRVGDCRFKVDFPYFFASRGATSFFAAVMNSWRVAVASAEVDALWTRSAPVAAKRRGLLSTAAADPDPCTTRDLCGTCNGQNACLDCAGTVNGLLRKDECGVCGADGTSCKGCDGVVNGKTYDACNVCGGDNTECRPVLAATNPLFPTSGNRRVPVVLTIRGSNILGTEDLACLFGSVRVPARLIRSPDDVHSVLCTAPLSPQTGPVAVSVQFTRVASKVALGVQAVNTFRTAPVTYTYRDGAGSLVAIVPASAPAFGAGSTSITVYGSGLLQADSNAFVQVDGRTIRPTNFSQDGCSFAFSLPPKGATHPYEQTLNYLPDGREAAQNPLAISYFNYPVVPTQLSPSRGWLSASSPSAIRLVGQNLGGLPKDARCRWSIPGGAAGTEVEVQAIRTDGGVSCPAPVPVRESAWGARGQAGLPKLGADCSKPSSGPCTCQATASASDTPAPSFEMRLSDSAFAGATFRLQVALAPNGVSFVEEHKLDFILFAPVEVESVAPTRVPATGDTPLTITLSSQSYGMLKSLLADASVFVNGVECSGLTLGAAPSSLSCVTGAMSASPAAPIAFSLAPGSGRSAATGAASTIKVFGDPIVSWGAAPTPVLASIYGGVSITVAATDDGSSAFDFTAFGLPKCAIASMASASAPLEILASWSAVSAANGNVNCGALPEMQGAVPGASLPLDYYIVLSVTNGASWSRQSSAAITVYDAMSPTSVFPRAAVSSQTSSGPVLVTGRLLYVPGRTRCHFGSIAVDALPESANDAIKCPVPGSQQLPVGPYSLAISLGSPRDLNQFVPFSVIAPFTVDATATRPAMLKLAEVCPASSSGSACVSVTITGTGFTNTGPLALLCRLRWGQAPDEATENPAVFVSATAVRCALPNLGDMWTGDFAVAVAFDGASFVEAGSVTVWDDARAPSLGGLLPSSASADATTAPTVTLSGTNFAPVAGSLKCLWADMNGAEIQTAAAFRSTTSATCAVPSYSNIAARKTLQLRVANAEPAEASAGSVPFTYVLVSVTTSTASIPSTVKAGETAVFSVTAFQSNGALSTDSGISFKIVVTPQSTQLPRETRTFEVGIGSGATGSVSFTESVAGSYSVQVLLGNDAIKTATLVVEPQPASLDASSATVTLTSLSAGSVSGSVSARIRDRYGNAISGASVVVSVRKAAGDALVWTQTTVTPASGSVAISLPASSLVAATSYVLSVSLDGADLSGATTSFAVVPGAPNAGKTLVSLRGCSPLVAGGSCNVEVVVRDAHENVIPPSRADVQEVAMDLFEAVLDPAAATKASGSSSAVAVDGCSFPQYAPATSSSEVKRTTAALSPGADGASFTTTVTLYTATTYRVALTLKTSDGAVLTPPLPITPHISVVAGDQSPAHTLLAEPVQNTIEAGVGRACLTFVALDRYGNARVGVENVFPWSLQLVGSPATDLSDVTISGGVASLGAARYGVAVGSRLAGSLQFVLGGGFAPLALTVTPSAADAAQTLLSVPAGSIPTAGSELVLRVLIRDAYKNALSLGTWGAIDDHLRVSVTAVGETQPAAAAHPPSVQLEYTASKDAVLARLLVVPMGTFRVEVSMRSAATSAFAQSVAHALLFQPAAAPAISRAVFAPTGDAVDVQFDMNTNMAGMVNPDSGFVASEDCSRVLSPATVLLLEGASCAWPSPSLLVISLGKASSVMPGDNIAVKAGVLANAIQNSMLSTASSTLLAPLRPLVPSATAVAPPVVSACSELLLQAVSISGGGNRAVTLTWSSRVVSPQGAAAVAAALDAAIAAQQGRASVNLTAIVRGLPDNAELEFSLTARNFFGNRGPVSSVRVAKRSDLTVSSVIRGSSSLSLQRTASLDLWAEVAVASCDPAASTVPRLAWSVAEPQGIDLASHTSVADRRLLLDLAKLDTRAFGSMRLQFQAEVDGAAASTASVLLTFVPSPVSVRLDKSGTVLVPTNGDLQLTATATDPDSATTSDWTYAWTCTDASGSLCAGSDFLDAATGRTVLLPGSFFRSAGATFLFTVTVQSASKRAVLESGSYAKASSTVSVFPADNVPVASKSSATLPSSLVAGDTATFRMTALDENGDPPTQAGVAFTIVVSAKSTQRPRAAREFTVVVGQNGVGSMSFSESYAGHYSVRVMLANEELSSSPYDLHVLPASVDPVMSTVAFTWGSLEAGASVGVALATVRDRFGNTIDGQTVSLTYSGPGALPAPIPPLTTSSGGVVSLDLPPLNKTGTYALMITVAGSNITGSPATFTITPSAPDLGESTLTVDWSSPQLVAGAQGRTATVVVRDRFGNAIDGAAAVLKITTVPPGLQVWTETAYTALGVASATLRAINEAGSYSLAATIRGLDVAGSPRAFTVVPAAANVSKTTVTFSGCTAMAAGDSCGVTVVVRDGFENVIAPSTSGSTAVTLRLLESAIGQAERGSASTTSLGGCSFPTYTVPAAAPESLRDTITLAASDDDGTAFAAALPLTTAAAYRVEVLVDGVAVPSAALPSAPQITVVPGDQSLGDSLLAERVADPTFRPSIEAGVGRACLTFVARDRFGNTRFLGSNSFPWTLTLLASPSLSLTATTLSSGPASLGAGHYGVAIGSTLTGDFELTLSQGFAPLGIAVSPSAADAARSTVTFDGCSGLIAGASQTCSATVSVRDAFGNTAQDGTTVVFTIAQGDRLLASGEASQSADSVAKPEPVAQPVADGDAEPEPIAQPVADGDAEPEPVAQPVADGDAEPEPVAQPVADGDAEPEPVAQPVADGDAEPEPPVADGDAEPEPVAQPVADGDAEPEPVAQPVADGDAEPEPVAQPVADGDAEPEPVAQPVADGDAEPEPVAQPVADGDAEPEPVAQPVADGDAEPEPVAQPVADGDAEPEPVAQPVADGDAEPEPVAKPVADGDAEPEPVAQPVADGDAEPEPVAQPVADGDAEPEPVAQPVADGDAEPEPEPLVVYRPPDNFTVTPPTLAVTVASVDLAAATGLRCTFRSVGSISAATIETAATVVSASALQCPAPAHPRFLPELWNVTYRVDVVAAGMTLPPLDAPNANTFTWSVFAPARAVATFAPGSTSSRYGQTAIRVRLAARRADVDATAAGVIASILSLPLPPVVAANPSLTASLLASMVSVQSVTDGSTASETILHVAIQHALAPQASVLPARAVAWAVATELAKPWARFGGAEVLDVALAAPISFPISIRLVSFVATEDLALESAESRLTRSLVNAREEVLFPGAAAPEPGYPSVSVVGSATAEDVRIEIYDTLQTTAHAFAQALRDYALCNGNVVDMAFVVITSSTVDTAAKAPALRDCPTTGTNPLLRLKGMPYGHNFVHITLSADFKKNYGNKNSEEKLAMRLQAIADAAERASTRSGLPGNIAKEAIRDSEFAPGSAGAVVMFTLGPVSRKLSSVPASYIANQLLQSRSASGAGSRFLGFPISSISISDVVPLDVTLTFAGAPPAAAAIETALRAALRAKFAELSVSRPTVFLRHLSTSGSDVTLRLLDYDALSATAMAQHVLDLYVCHGSTLEGVSVAGMVVAPSVPAPPELDACVLSVAATPSSTAVLYTRQPGFSAAPSTVTISGEGFPTDGGSSVVCRYEPVGSSSAARAASPVETAATVLNSTNAVCATPHAPAFLPGLWPVTYRVGLKVASRPLDAYSRTTAIFTWELVVPPLSVASAPSTGLRYGQAAVHIALGGAAISAVELDATVLAPAIRAFTASSESAFSLLSDAALMAMVTGSTNNGSLVVTFEHEASTSASVVPSHTFARALAAALAAPWSAFYDRPVLAVAVSQPVPYPAAVYSVGFAGNSPTALQAALDAARLALLPDDGAIPGFALSAVTGTTLDGAVALYDGVAATGMAFAAALQQHAVCEGNALGGLVVLGVAGTPAFPRCPAPAAGVAGIPGGSALARITMDLDFATFVAGLGPDARAALRERAADSAVALVAAAQGLSAAAVRQSLKDVAFAPGSVVAAFAFGPVEGASVPASSLLAQALVSGASGSGSFLEAPVKSVSAVSAESPSGTTHVDSKNAVAQSGGSAASSPSLGSDAAASSGQGSLSVPIVAACSAAVALVAVVAVVLAARRYKRSREDAMRLTTSRGRSASLALNIDHHAGEVTHVEAMPSEDDGLSPGRARQPNPTARPASASSFLEPRLAWSPRDGTASYSAVAFAGAIEPAPRSHRSKSEDLPSIQLQDVGSDGDRSDWSELASGVRKARRPSSLIIG